MTPADWAAIGVPTVTVALAAFATYAGPLGKYLAVKTHNERLERITAAAGRYAAQASQVLASLPPNSSMAGAKTAVLADATNRLRVTFAESAAAIGASDLDLVGIIQGEFDKLPPRIAGVVGNSIVPAAAVSDITAEHLEPHEVEAISGAVQINQDKSSP
jgi:hypothetical protein